MLLSTKIDLFGLHMNAFFRVIKRKTHLLWGVGNRCKDGSYILFLDYDDTPIDWVTEEIRLIQKRYMMIVGTAYLFKTRKGIHAVFLEKNDLEDVIEIMKITSADKQHREIPLYHGRRIWVLRGSPKRDETLEYLGCITKSDDGATLGNRSLAHKNYLKTMFSIPERDFARGNPFDDDDTVTLAFYHVGKDDA
jgi:hypothetical protein